MKNIMSTWGGYRLSCTHRKEARHCKTCLHDLRRKEVRGVKGVIPRG